MPISVFEPASFRSLTFTLQGLHTEKIPTLILVISKLEFSLFVSMTHPLHDGFDADTGLSAGHASPALRSRAGRSGHAGWDSAAVLRADLPQSQMSFLPWLILFIE